nr:ribonuclease H-like domain-containing protein [Tanacetum cinerariifolium]
MKMEQYLAHTDYALWEVILNGNGKVQMKKNKAGNEVEVPPITAQQILTRTREIKAKSTLLMAIPDEHLARFHGIKDAKTLWAAIKTKFGGKDTNQSSSPLIAPPEAPQMVSSVKLAILKKESRSKMIEKQNDPKMTEKKVITKQIDCAIINQLSIDFETRFVPQTELSAEQAFWSQYSVQTDEPILSACTTIVEVPKELPKVSMGTWGFAHTKACFRDNIIPFVKSLKELFTSFDQCLIDEVTKVQNVFKQMELAVEQHYEEKNNFKNKMENILQENDRLLTQALSVEIMNVVVH